MQWLSPLHQFLLFLPRQRRVHQNHLAGRTIRIVVISPVFVIKQPGNIRAVVQHSLSDDFFTHLAFAYTCDVTSSGSGPFANTTGAQ